MLNVNDGMVARAIKSLQAILFGVFLVGCSVNQTTTVTSDGKQVIETNSGALAAALSVVDTKVGSVGYGDQAVLRVQASIKNDSRFDQNFQYKFKWLDKDGFEVAIDGRAWVPLTITAYETKSVQAVAPNPTVQSFKIMVQD